MFSRSCGRPSGGALGFLLALLTIALAQPACARAWVSGDDVRSEFVSLARSASTTDAPEHGLHSSAARPAASEPAGANHAREIDELLRRAEAHQLAGHHRVALEDLRAGLALAEKAGDPARLALLSGSLGSLYMAMGELDAAERELVKSRDLARGAGLTRLEAVTLTNLGNLYAEKGDAPQALSAYERSIDLALAAGQGALAARADINAARLLMSKSEPEAARSRLERALRQLDQMPPDAAHALDLMAAGLLYRDLAAAEPSVRQSLALAYTLLQRAAHAAGRVEDARTESYALGYLGQLYEDQERTEEALRLTRRALFLAQTAGAPESLYLWQWQTGRLLVAQDQPDAAIKAYEDAVRTLQSIRVDLPAFDPRTGESLFRKRVGSVFLELADLLLQQAADADSTKAVQAYLVNARTTVEQLKTAELEDYFRDDCVALLQSRIKTIDQLPERTAALYPIILPDRTEFLLSLPDGRFARAVLHIPEDELTRELHQFRRSLQNPQGSTRPGSRVLRHAQKLYNWLIEPIASELSANTIETLVFIPDGALRLIPLAALHDGEEFLAAQFAIATAPGLTLLDPRPISRAAIRPLLAGLTEPVEGFHPLPGVEAELGEINKMYSSKVLLDEIFIRSHIQKEIDEVSYSVFHVASHAQFSSDPQKTFILTYDGKLDLDSLEQLINPTSLRDQPIELITLSACETAAGDDRAALGLAGVAVKAGARSALATLWRVEDAAAAQLVAEFYKQLNDRRLSKAEALQQAQMSLLEEGEFEHPYYWAPYLIIGSWL